jgi:hypothetical protein
MPKGIYERKPKETHMTETAAPQPSKMFPVTLNKNYCPAGAYEIVGYLKEAVKRKDAYGVERIVEPEEFIPGEMKPHEMPGVGFPDKIWAGTKVRLPLAEAKRLIAKQIAERADDIAA